MLCSFGDLRWTIFDFSGLCVADGSVFPRSIGRNPSRTIAGLAERVARGIIAEATA